MEQQGHKKCTYTLLENTKERGHLRELEVEGRVVSEVDVTVWNRR
jgi:hypothetical protein